MQETLGSMVQSRTIHHGRVFSVTSDLVRLPNGHEATMEVIRHRSSVILIPMPDPHHVVLVRQYRYCINRWIWELPAGTLNSNETPEAAARRECEEETGKVPSIVERLGMFYPTPGYCDEQMIFFRLTDLGSPTHPAPPDEDEILKPRIFSIKEALTTIFQADVVDMKSAFGLTLV